MLLNEFSAFEGLTESQKAAFISACEARAVSAGDDLLSEDTPSDAVYFVMQGKLRAHLGGRELATLTAPCVIGELELLTRETYVVTVTALENVEALLLPYAAFRQRLVDDDVAALKIVHRFAEILAQRLAAMDRTFAAAQ